MLSLQNAAIVAASLIALSTVSGVLYAVLLQPQDQSQSKGANRVFALFCLSLLMWSVVALAGPFEAMRLGADETVRGYALATMIGLSAVTFFLVVIDFSETRSPITRAMRLISPLIVLLALVVVWSGNAFVGSTSDETGFRFLPFGGLMLGVQIFYALVAFVIIMSAGKTTTAQLRLPGLMMMAVYISVAIPALLRFPVALLLATAAASLMGRVMLRHQLVKPVNAVHDELRVANRDLEQTLNELANERKTRERLSDELTAIGRSRNDFLDTLGHKLRTRLHSIIGYTELLQSGVYGDLNEKQADRLGKVDHNVAMLLALINHMLDLNRIDAGRMTLQKMAFPIARAVEHAIQDAESIHGENSASIQAQIASDLPMIVGDEARIRQVILELLQTVAQTAQTTLESTAAPSNVIEAIENRKIGRPAIQIVVERVRVSRGEAETFKLPFKGWLTDGEWVICQVMKPGMAFPSEKQAHIFDTFYQSEALDGVPTDASESTGLGLAIAKRLVELHEGLLWLHTTPNYENSFVMALRGIASTRE